MTPPGSYQRVQRWAVRVKVTAELLSGVVAVAHIIQANSTGKELEVTVLFPLVIAGLALAEVALRWRPAHRIKALAEMSMGAISIAFLVRAWAGHHEFEVIDGFVAVLGLAALAEWWIHRVHARRHAGSAA